MKSGFYYTKSKRKKTIKILKTSFKYIFTIFGPKMAIIITWFSYGVPKVSRWFSYGFPMVFLVFSYDFPMISDMWTTYVKPPYPPSRPTITQQPSKTCPSILYAHMCSKKRNSEIASQMGLQSIGKHMDRLVFLGFFDICWLIIN